MRDKSLFPQYFPLPALQEETTAPPSNSNFEATRNFVCVPFSNATASRDKLCRSKRIAPRALCRWRHRFASKRIVVSHIYKRDPDISRTTWNNKDGAQYTKTLLTRQGPHHYWPWSSTAGRYGADDRISENRRVKFSNYNSSTDFGPWYAFAPTPRFTNAKSPTAQALICGNFSLYSRNFGSPLPLFAPISAQHTLLPSQTRCTSSHLITAKPRASTTNTGTARRKFEATHCLRIISDTTGRLKRWRKNLLRRWLWVVSPVIDELAFSADCSGLLHGSHAHD
jgi:hypothetical protein